VEGGQLHMDVQKIEPTDVILSSFHSKKMVFFVPEFHLWTEQKVAGHCTSYFKKVMLFHVDGLWTPTREGVSVSCRQGET